MPPLSRIDGEMRRWLPALARKLNDHTREYYFDVQFGLLVLAAATYYYDFIVRSVQGRV